MEYHLKAAIEDVKQKEEKGINYIYAKTYNYVYLRAKSILRRETDVQQLMRDVYVKMIESSAELSVENLYEWLGEYAYRLGCGYYRKKKIREDEILESEEIEFAPRMIEYPEETKEVIEKSLEELPDLYQATFYAFYYDYMSVQRIAALMDCSEGIILNRLNYTRKYMIRALENYNDETKLNVFYSVEGVCRALRKWSTDHCLGMIAAQSVYSEICKCANVQPAPIYLEGKEFAGVKNTVVYHKSDDYTFIKEQMEKYASKPGADKKVIGILAVLFVVIVAVVIAVAAFVGTKKSPKDDKKEPVKTEQQKEDEIPEDETDGEEPKQDETQNEDEIIEPIKSEYIIADSDKRLLTRAELEGFSKAELRLARNEIYARHGMIFGAQDLRDYFESKSWYKGTVPFDDFYNQVEVSEIEATNIGLFVQMEEEKQE